MTDQAAVTCAIVTYNSAGVIDSCLLSLRRQLADREILIYDNDSRDDTVQRVEAVSPEIRVIRGNQNVGFGRAVNALRSEVLTPYLLLLNPDAVVQPGTINELVDLADKLGDAAVIGAVQVTPEGSYVGPIPSEERFREVDVIFGAAMLLRLALFPDVSPLFDPRFWMYCEDADLCMTVARRGHRIVLANRALVLHAPGSSSALSSSAATLAIKRRQYLEYLVSGCVFRFKHKGRLQTLIRSAASMVVSYLRYIVLLLRRDPGRYPMYQRSLACFLFYFRVWG